MKITNQTPAGLVRVGDTVEFNGTFGNYSNMIVTNIRPTKVMLVITIEGLYTSKHDGSVSPAKQVYRYKANTNMFS